MPIGFAARGETPSQDMVSPCVHLSRFCLYRYAALFFASHPRIADHARMLGLQQVIVAGPGDDEMFKGITGFFAKVAT